MILAIGQKAESEHLDSLGLMAGEKVRTDWDSMRTADPKVFAAGDGAFGPSTIVNAMYHGHRAAYYVKHFLEGNANPLPYRTPYKTRRVPVAQDALWEVFARENQEFHGLGDNPVAFPEIESTYDDETAKREAARCYRCDAETGSADYNVRTREDIFVMARTKPEDARKQRAVFTRRLTVSHQAHFNPQVPSLDDIVFLPANLSRLVIDPYRDACRVATPIGPELELRAPFLAAGFDDAPPEVRAAVAHGARGPGARIRRTPSARPRRALAPDRRRRRGRADRGGSRPDHGVSRRLLADRPRAPARSPAARHRRPRCRAPRRHSVRARARLRPPPARGEPGNRRRLAGAGRRTRSLRPARRDTTSCAA